MADHPSGLGALPTPMLSWAWLRCTPVAMGGLWARGLRSFACASAVWACKGLAWGMFSGARFGLGVFTGLRAAPRVKGARWAWGLSGAGAGAGAGARQLGQRAEQAVGAWRRVAGGLARDAAWMAGDCAASGAQAQPAAFEG